MAGKRGREIYSDPRWLRLRNAARERAGCLHGTSAGKCERCGRLARLEVHHIKPLESGGEAFPPLDGLEAICRPCHFGQHRRARSQRRNVALAKSQAGWDILAGYPGQTDT